MLRQIYIILNDNIIYQRNYAKGLDDSLFTNVYLNIKKAAFAKFADVIRSYEFFEFKLSYIVEKSLNLIFLFVTGLGDEFKNIKPQLSDFRKEFLDFYHDNIKENNLKSEEIPMQHIPTITGEVATIKIGKLHFFLWDFAGQDQFDFLWEKFIRGSDAVLLMTDSTLENLEKSKYFFLLVNKEVPYARLAVIANKQDLPEAMKVEDIERLMGTKTYSFIAIDPNNRPKMIRIIADLLDMDAKVSPLLKPIFERDTLMDKAQKALELGEFNETVEIFEKISNICLELGDDSLAIELQEKADKLRSFLG